MGYWLRGHEGGGGGDNCFGKIQLVGQKYRDKTTLASKTRFSLPRRRSKEFATRSCSWDICVGG